MMQSTSYDSYFNSNKNIPFQSVENEVSCLAVEDRGCYDSDLSFYGGFHDCYCLLCENITFLFFNYSCHFLLIFRLMLFVWILTFVIGKCRMTFHFLDFNFY